MACTKTKTWRLQPTIVEEKTLQPNKDNKKSLT